MAKYHKAASGSRSKRKKFETLPVVVEAGQSYLDQLIRARLQKEIQEALEAERDEVVARPWHRHHGATSQKQYRNGYADPRSLTCGCGTVQLQIPRLRQAYESKIVGKYERLTPELQQLIPQLYLHGLSLGDFEQAYGWLWGTEAPLSQASILRLKSTWEKDYQDWKKRPLDREYLYVWADGIYPKWKALRPTFPMALRQRCWIHKMRNVLDKVPKKVHDEVLYRLREMYRAKSYNGLLFRL